MMMALTDIGDSLVLGGMVLVSSIYLVLAKCTKGALVLISALVFSSAGIGIAKLIFMGCDSSIRSSLNLTSPSGHAALSVGVLGTYALLMTRQLRGVWRCIPAFICIPVVLAIAASRIFLNFHTLSEVLIGLFIGIVVLLGIGLSIRRRSIPSFNVHALLLYMIVAAVALHGFHAPAEHYVRQWAGYLSHYVPLCEK